MTPEQPRQFTALSDACVAALRYVDPIGDPVARLSFLADIADQAATVLRTIEMATSEAVRNALQTMTLDELSSRPTVYQATFSS